LVYIDNYIDFESCFWKVLLSVSYYYILYLHNSKFLFETMLLGLESIILLVLMCVMLAFSINYVHGDKMLLLARENL